MRGRLVYHPLRLAGGRRIHLFKLERGALAHEREADEIAARLRERLFNAHRPADVVLMEGEPGEDPRLFGLEESVAQVRALLPAVARHAWAPVQLEPQSATSAANPKFAPQLP
jgi:hypothetical protein